MSVHEMINVKQEELRVLREDRDMGMIEKLNDPNYYPILHVLRHGPMTVQELKTNYDDFVDAECQNIENCKYSKKSDKTIYRYIKDLEAVNLVVAAGKRVTIGKTAAETLYSRKSKVIYLAGSSQKWWESEAGHKFNEKIIKLLELYLDKKVKSTDILMQNINEFFTEHNNETAKALEENIEGFGEVFKEATDFGEVQKLFRHLSIMIAFICDKDDKRKQILDCFE